MDEIVWDEEINEETVSLLEPKEEEVSQSDNNTNQTDGIVWDDNYSIMVTAEQGKEDGLNQQPISSEKQTLIEDEYTLKKNRILKAKEEYPDNVDIYDLALNKLEQNKLDKIEQEKLNIVKKQKEAEILASARKDTALNRTASTGIAIAGGGARPALGIARMVEDIGQSLGIGDNKDDIVEWMSDNELMINEQLEKLGYDKDSIMNPANLGEILTNILPVAKLSKLRYLIPAETTLGGVSEYGSGEVQTDKMGDTMFTPSTPNQAVNQGLIQGAFTLGGGLIVKGAIRAIQGKEGAVYNRLKENLSMSSDEEDKIYSDYAKAYNKKPEELTMSEKVSALAYGHPDAKSILMSSLGSNDVQKLHSEFNDFARKTVDDLNKNIDAGDEVEIQKLINGISDELGAGWKDYREITDLHYGDIFVEIKRGSSELQDLMNIAKETNNTKIQQMLFENKVGLNELLDMKQILGSLTYGKKPALMNKAEKIEFDYNRKVLDKISKLYEDNLPEGLQKFYKGLNRLTQIKSQADKKGLFSTFKIEGKNIEPKHVEDIAKEMKAKQKGSSYDSFISLMGKRTEASSKVEGNLIQNIIKGNTKNGIADFVKIYDNIEELNFKTPQGKAIKDVLSYYKDVFKNVTDVKLSNLSEGGSNAGLTLNPAVSLAYSAHRSTLDALKSFIGVTSSQRTAYVIKNLPSILETKKIPKMYTLKEQRGAVSFSRFTESLKKLADGNPEELEAQGRRMEYYDSSQMIGAEGAARIGKDEGLEDAIRLFDKNDIDSRQKTWKETKWYSDEVDGQWKFHLAGDNVRIKIPKGKMTREGSYNTEDVIDMPELFEAYPELKNRQIMFTSMTSKNTLGGYYPETGDIVINRNYDWTNGGETGFIEEIKKTIVHELQHSVQGIEGFGKGGNTSNLSFNDYASLHGEVEARALTKGAGEYPKKIYDREYDTGAEAYRTNPDEAKPLNRNVQNYYGKKVGDNSPDKPIRRGD